MKLNEYELKRLKKERMEEIDKWLDNEYGVSYTRLEELHDFVVEQDLKHREEKDKEIERLNKENEELKKIQCTYLGTGCKAEIERLNNIINELEEYIKPFLYMLNGITDRDIYEECQLADFTMIMEKLQELKGSVK